MRGQVKVRLHNPQSSTLRPGLAVTLAGADSRRAEVVEVSQGPKDLLVRFDGVVDLDQAEALRGTRVAVERHLLEPPEEGEYYYADLVGCSVRDEHGAILGVVHAVFEAGASDILVVRAGDRERFIPLVDEWMEAVDITGRQICIRGSGDEWETWQVG